MSASNSSERSVAVSIVGAGLVGSLLAALLARRGHRVTVHERRPDLRRSEGAGGRSINLVLTRRGIRALDRVGLAEGALRLTVPVTGRMMHALDGTLAYQPYGRSERECNHSIPRTELNRYLIDQAEALGARFRFGLRLDRADLDAGALEFVHEDTGTREGVGADVVFGADGAGSALREAFRNLDGFVETVDLLSHGYKELHLPPAEDGAYRIRADALHIWPRGHRMLMALANLDGSFTGTLYLPVEGEDGFDALASPADVEALFATQFPDAVPCIPDLARQYFDRPTGTLGTVRCGPWHLGDRALLIGDAAHAIVPFFGQGMNAGFEDCRVLDDLLDRFGDRDWERVFPEFTRLRKPNADAIAALALDNFVEMSARVADPAFLLRKAVEHRLEESFPLEYRSRYSMVMYSHIPFDLCREAGVVQDAMLGELCAGIRRPDDLDLNRAHELIRERFVPFLREHGLSLNY